MVLLEWPVEFLAERNSDNYVREVGLNTINNVAAWNIGVEWAVQRNFKVTASWLYGSKFGLNLVLHWILRLSPKRRQAKPFIALRNLDLSGAPK